MNDTLGQPVGDELLGAVAKRLKQQAGETAMVASLEWAATSLSSSGPLFDGNEQAGVLASRIIQRKVTPSSSKRMGRRFEMATRCV
ncbi:GGDEF domain-containing protein [Mesorhizobium sp. NFR06]|uniref:GGDEF domain-containing protein n=1 Tax=Mesorhizobium sp. NFR06 TaxID=1566290 RepID=UPI001FCEE76A|nr:GGDEF domain-containing protein [Mesorhizobium sp. NFR06]